MREHKYKAYEKTLNEIIPVYSIDFENKIINVNGAWRRFDEIELLQYTGLKDKNGVEIYEGYILEGGYTNSMTGEFISKKYVVNDAEALNRCKLIGHTPFGDTWLKFIKAPEVIGNIYQDKHLLEG